MVIWMDWKLTGSDFDVPAEDSSGGIGSAAADRSGMNVGSVVSGGER